GSKPAQAEKVQPGPSTASSQILPRLRQSTGDDSAPSMNKKGITLAGAKLAIQAVEKEARQNKAGAAVAVVDEGGNLLAFSRVDLTFPAGANISIGKARTAAMFKRPTAFFEKLVNDGRTTMVALPDFTPLQGGIPIVVDGDVIGAVGVSGASS